ncbi:MAG TPA: hypothetical protein VJ885_07435 [Thermoanaerobaculia bacterium]|nr:hypothetical protein [Thermoanaerobaculia bacterium]
MRPPDPRPPFPRQTTWKTAAVLLLAGLGFLWPVGAGAEPGDLDPTFSGDGRVVTEFLPSREHTARAVVLQPDGRIVVAGDAFWPDTGFDFTLVRYLSDGSLDPSFGVGGVARAHFYGADRAMDLVLQPDGKIVAVGQTALPGDSPNFALARFNPDGSLDAGFGNGGRVVTEIMGATSWLEGVALRPDGKILVGGSIYRGNSDLALAQYNPDGSLDTTFGNGGWLVLEITGAHEQPTDMVLQPDGKIVLVGFVFRGTGEADSLLVRFLADGNLDSAFGNGGHVIPDLPGADRLMAVTLQPDGKIVATGFSPEGGTWRSILLRLVATGAPDPGFGAGGVVFGPLWRGEAVAVQPNGKIVVAGNALTGAGFQFALARYLEDGSLDLEFGEGGWVATAFSSSQSGEALGVALQRDGKIVAVGRGATDASTLTYVVARYLGDEVEEEGLCLQHEGCAPTLRLDPRTGAYRFSDSGSGLVLEAVGTVRGDGCTVHLKDHGPGKKKPERILNAVIDTCAGTGHATLRISASKKNYKIRDRNIANSVCD